MTEASKDPDQSMEDILQSIKRIIADEGEPAPATAGSDVLELTELLAEDVATPPVADEPVVPSISIDDIMSAPISAMPQAPVAPPEPAPAPEPVMAMVPEPAPQPQPQPVKAAPAPVIDDSEKLMSDATMAASLAALNALSHKPSSVAHHNSPVFRSGETVEDLVIEALKPMLKEWLDNNLPSMVRTLVEKEIRRLSA